MQKERQTTLFSGLLALSPLMVFLLLYLALSIVAGDFYKVPVTVAFLIAAVFAVAIAPGRGLAERVECFSEGVAQPGLLLMVWIFILAGAFAASAKAMGAIQATVDLSLWLLPPQLLLAGLFLAACFISLSVGTSVGTIVALVPIASGIAEETGLSLPMIVGIVVGGAYFGDNLSFISDTTIMATRSQGCRLSDKFRVNAMIVVPAAALVLAGYFVLGARMEAQEQTTDIQWLLVFPYILVLVTAACGVDVLLVLVLGIAATGLIGLGTGSFSFFDWLSAMGDGILGMSELIIVTLLASGMVAVIRRRGGIDFLLARLTRRISGKRGAELCIAALVMLTDLCTANNTIAILTVGPLARDISQRFCIDPRRSASLLDTASCIAQSFLPYGAQMLMACGLAALNPLDIIPYLYYPMVMAVCLVLAILFRYPRRFTRYGTD